MYICLLIILTICIGQITLYYLLKKNIFKHIHGLYWEIVNS